MTTKEKTPEKKTQRTRTWAMRMQPHWLDRMQGIAESEGLTLAAFVVFACNRLADELEAGKMCPGCKGK